MENTQTITELGKTEKWRRIAKEGEAGEGDSKVGQTLQGIVHPTRQIIAVKGLIVREDKMLLLQRAPDDETGASEWECAGGKVDFGEQLEDSLAREIEEETGLQVKVGKLLYGTTFLTSPARQVVLLMYLCPDADGEVRLSPEHASACWAEEKQARQLLPPSIAADFDRYHVFGYLAPLPDPLS